MYAIPFFPEVMEYRFISVRIKLENSSKVVRSAPVRRAENISLLIQIQIGIRICAGLAAWETVQNCELARRRYFENGAVVVRSTLISSPIKISFRVSDQSSIGVRTVRGTVKAIFHTLLPGWCHFEHRAAPVNATIRRGAIDVPGRVENQSGIWTFAVRAPEAVHSGLNTFTIYLEHRAAPSNIARVISTCVSYPIKTSVLAGNHSARQGPFCTRGFWTEIVDDGFASLSIQFEHGAGIVCSALECRAKKVTSRIAE